MVENSSTSWGDIQGEFQSGRLVQGTSQKFGTQSRSATSPNIESKQYNQMSTGSSFHPSNDIKTMTPDLMNKNHNLSSVSAIGSALNPKVKISPENGHCTVTVPSSISTSFPQASRSSSPELGLASNQNLNKPQSGETGGAKLPEKWEEAESEKTAEGEFLRGFGLLRTASEPSMKAQSKQTKDSSLSGLVTESTPSLKKSLTSIQPMKVASSVTSTPDRKPSNTLTAQQQSPNEYAGKQLLQSHKSTNGRAGLATQIRRLNSAKNLKSRHTRSVSAGVLSSQASASPKLTKKGSFRGKSSAYRGVSYNKKNMKWKSVLTVACKQHFLGYFSSEIDAAKAYDREALRRKGDDACTNFPANSSAGSAPPSRTPEQPTSSAFSDNPGRGRSSQPEPNSRSRMTSKIASSKSPKPANAGSMGFASRSSSAIPNPENFSEEKFANAPTLASYGPVPLGKVAFQSASTFQAPMGEFSLGQAPFSSHIDNRRRLHHNLRQGIHHRSSPDLFASQRTGKRKSLDFSPHQAATAWDRPFAREMDQSGPFCPPSRSVNPSSSVAELESEFPGQSFEPLGIGNTEVPSVVPEWPDLANRPPFPYTDDFAVSPQGSLLQGGPARWMEGQQDLPGMHMEVERPQHANPFGSSVWTSRPNVEGGFMDGESHQNFMNDTFANPSYVRVKSEASHYQDKELLKMENDSFSSFEDADVLYQAPQAS